MPLEVIPDSQVAATLQGFMVPKLAEMGLASESEATGLAEFVILALANQRSESEITRDIAVDLFSLPADDPTIASFSKWLFEQMAALETQMNGGAAPGAEQASFGDMDTDMNAQDGSELNAPTGPRSMRNGNGMRGGRDKRMLGQIGKAMDRSADSALHRTRGNNRINSHGNGMRGGARGGRNNGIRAGNLQAGLAAGPNNGQWMMSGQPPNQMELMAMLEQQNQMMFQLSQQLMSGGGGGGRGRGKSLFERTQNGRVGRGRGGHHNQNGHGDHQQQQEGGGDKADGEDMEMGGGGNPPNPDESVCKYNLRCTNSECKFGHQSPAAPPGTTVDLKDICSFAAACKNRKCVGRHPSPATRLAHQGEQDCKFFPNCQNRRCPFRHPSMPLCRNGADCTTADCKFTHVKTKCKFTPCLNPKCAFAHEEGQQGGFKDKVWTAEGGEHVSERKFVEDGQGEEIVKPDAEMQPEQMQSEQHDVALDEAIA
ncbi:hypothetical protein VHEMI02414 [[Torrubiella] hemipterigena]|uniref:Nab2-like CCCH zinc finger domain-containing protein n=1 Tax=[Torrubiella] hemipterigena TaxID=1531966 RepID=A0A0A1SPI4_9HYPO|nr:hypothetical protein VHEMI02414 [[Torrubiella] hemipterigena]